MQCSLGNDVIFASDLHHMVIVTTHGRYTWSLHMVATHGSVIPHDLVPRLCPPAMSDRLHCANMGAKAWSPRSQPLDR